MFETSWFIEALLCHHNVSTNGSSIISLIHNYVFDITIVKMAQRVGVLCGATIKIDFVSDFPDMEL